jgi:hypothetical protein
MQGDSRTRTCATCQLPVHHLTAMTRADAEALLASHQGRLCARYYRKYDGTIATADDDVPTRRASWLAALAGIAGLLGPVQIYQHASGPTPTAPAALVDPSDSEVAEVQAHYAEHEPAPPAASDPRQQAIDAAGWHTGVIVLGPVPEALAFASLTK